MAVTSLHKRGASNAMVGRHSEGRTSWLALLCAPVIILSLVLGGGTRSGFLSDAILELAALPLLLAALWRLWDVEFDPRSRWVLRVCLLVALLPLAQLIPLPPQIWTSLPNRGPLAETFDLLGGGLPWAPISVNPRATWLAALSMVPPVAVFLGVVLLNRRERRLLSLVLLSAGVLGVFVGLLQAAQGPDSPLRFYQITNPSEAVGFFANRNHYAAFLYTLTLFAAAWAVDAATRVGSAPAGKKFEAALLIAVAASFTILVTLVGAQAMARSRAGIGITMLALCGSFALASVGRRGESKAAATRFMAVVVVLGALFAIQFALYRMLDRFTDDPMADARIPFARNTIEAARAFMPFGAGFGSFTSVYGLFERPQDILANTYANRAHNDILEFWLETGMAGMALMGALAAWLVSRIVAVWRSPAQQIFYIDLLLMRAATMVVTLLIIHSFVDYPLRTGAMMAIMAFACALLVDPPLGVGEDRVEPLAADAQQMVKSRSRRRHMHKAPSPKR